MSAGFVNTLRARGQTLTVGAPGADAITLRVQVPEVWDVVRVSAARGEPVLAVKRAAAAALLPEETDVDDLVVKLNGFEVLDEGASLADAGVRNGSTLLVTHRRRRPIR